MTVCFNNMVTVRGSGSTPSGIPNATVIPTPLPAAPSQFFADQKKGEVNELKQLLKLVQSERSDYQKQRDTLKKVVAFMTLGIDVSRLFSEMIMACCTNDIVQKKMIYLYLSTYAETNPELALLAVNTLQKDSCDDDPAIRGLALRSLCSFRSSDIVEYLEPAVRRGLSDCSGYVRRTAVIGVLKLYHISPITVLGHEVLSFHTEDDINQLIERNSDHPTDHLDHHLIRLLFAMLQDIDPQVVSNVINVLNEILASEGGLPFTRRLAATLLNRIRQFNEWGQCTILGLISNYVPETSEEMFDILNILEDRIKYSSSAVVLAATRCFINLTSGHTDLELALLQRLKAPFLTLITTASVELSYVVLLHLLHLLLSYTSDISSNTETSLESLPSRVLGNDYKIFFCALTDPVYIKLVKLDVLTTIVSQITAGPILDELAEYIVIDVDSSVIRKSINCMGIIGLRYFSFMIPIVHQLINFMDLNVEYITGPIMIVLRNFLRHNREVFPHIQTPLEQHFPSLTHSESLSASLWIIGEFGELIQKAPYLIENIVETYVTKPNNNHLNGLTQEINLSSHLTQIKLTDSFLSGIIQDDGTDTMLLELVSASLKLFLKRPPEMQPILGKLFKLILQDDSLSFDVRDRVLHFYRFLLEAQSSNNLLEKLSELLCSSIHQVVPGERGSLFLEDAETISLNLSSVDFNTLSLIFKLPPSKFLAVKDIIPFCGRFIPPNKSVLPSPLKRFSQRLPKRLTSTTSKVIDYRHQTSNILPASSVSSTLLPITDDSSAVSTSNDLLQLDNLSAISFLSSGSGLVDSSLFQRYWSELGTGFNYTTTFNSVILNTLSETDSDDSIKHNILDPIDRAFAALNIFCLAFGKPNSDTVRFFFYGQLASLYSTICLIQLDIQLTLNVSNATFTLKLHSDESTVKETTNNITANDIFSYVVNDKQLKLFFVQ